MVKEQVMQRGMPMNDSKNELFWLVPFIRIKAEFHIIPALCAVLFLKITWLKWCPIGCSIPDSFFGRSKGLQQ